MEAWETYLAGVRLGAIVVPVNFRLVADEVAYVLADSGATALVVDAALAGVAAKAREQAPDVATVLVIGEEFEAALAAAGDEPLDVVVDEDEPAFIMYTSGTTGRPKGAVLTHRNLLMHVFSQVTHLGWHPEDRVAAPGAPLFHIAGLAGGLPPLLVGGTNVIMKSGAFDPVADPGHDRAGEGLEHLPGAGHVGGGRRGARHRRPRPVAPAPDLLGRGARVDHAAAHDDRHVPAGGGRHRVRADRVQPGHLLPARRGLDPQDRLGRHADAQRRGARRRRRR